jgi:hypothetical protein
MQEPAPVACGLPAKPDRRMPSPAPPALDRTCRFPWFGFDGCRGKDPSAMLRLTVSTIKSKRGAWMAPAHGLRPCAD